MTKDKFLKGIKRSFGIENHRPMCRNLFMGVYTRNAVEEDKDETHV